MASPGFDVRWIHGTPRGGERDPPLQVHMYDEGTAIIRQSKDVSHEAPFMYLFFGAERALLLDTGATPSPERSPIRKTVDGLVGAWLQDHPREGYGLVVAHTHGHGDHVAGDGQFMGREDTVVVPKDLEAVKRFFGVESWPAGRGEVELGGRALEVIGSPGHHPAAVTFYDPSTRFLVTGDTVYPGRLYAFDFPAFAESLDRLVDFAGERGVSYLMGCHIEMSTTPGKDYPVGTRFQPQEPPLQMEPGRLGAVRDAARGDASTPGPHYYDDFAIYNGACTGALLRQLIRGKAGNAARALGLGSG